MSTGTSAYDESYAIDTTGCGAGYVRIKSTKTWSGGDGSHREEHPYVMNHSASFDSPITWEASSMPGQIWDGTPEACGFAPDISYHELDDEFERKLVLKLGEKVRQHKFNAAVNAGELRESISMIGSTARVLAASYGFLRKGNYRKALRTLGVDLNRTTVGKVREDLADGAGNAWLGLTYGWLPLIGAVRDAADSAAANLVPRRTSFRARSSIDGTTNGIGLVRSSLQIKWEIAEEQQFTTLEEFGFLDPELVAWELMPYSFVVDWFAPIGNFLEARSILNKLEGRYTRTLFKRGRVRMRNDLPGTTVLSGHSHRVDASVDRSVGLISNMPLPGLSLKNPYSLSHVASGLALLRNVFKS